MPPGIPYFSPHIAVYRRAPAFLALFGGAFAAIGVLTFALSVSPVPDVAGILAGTVFTLVGVLIVIGRPKITLDYQQRQIRERLSLFSALRRRAYAFDAFTGVAMSREWRRTEDRRGYYTYIVWLEGRQRLELREFGSFFRARRVAEDIATRLQVPLVDKTDGRAFTRAPTELHKAVQDRLIESERAVHAPNLKHIQDWINERADTLTIQLPRKVLRLRTVLEFLSAATAAVIMAYFLFRLDAYLGIAGSAMLAVMIAAAIVFLPAAYREYLVLNPDSVTFVQDLKWLSWSHTIALNELEELRSPAKGSLLLRSDDQQFKIRSITPDEKRELTHLIKYWAYTHANSLRA